MNKIIKIIIILIPILIILQNCSTSESGLKTDPATGVTLQHQGIQLHFDTQMYCSVSFKSEGKILSFNLKNDGEGQPMPSHFVYIDDKLVGNFEIDFNNLIFSNIETNFGKGKQLILNGIANVAQMYVLVKN